MDNLMVLVIEADTARKVIRVHRVPNGALHDALWAPRGVRVRWALDTESGRAEVGYRLAQWRKCGYTVEA